MGLENLQLVIFQGILLHLDLLVSGIVELVDFDCLWMFPLRLYSVQGIIRIDIFFLLDVLNDKFLGLYLLLKVGDRTRHRQSRLAWTQAL